MKLPLFLKPIYSSDLIRVGKLNDGGYIVSKNSILDANYLVSFGLNDDWSFEKNFSDFPCSPGVIISHVSTNKKGSLWGINFLISSISNFIILNYFLLLLFSIN